MNPVRMRNTATIPNTTARAMCPTRPRQKNGRSSASGISWTFEYSVKSPVNASFA